MLEHGANTGGVNPTPADRRANGNGEILARRFERGHAVAPPRRVMNVRRFACQEIPRMREPTKSGIWGVGQIFVQRAVEQSIQRLHHQFVRI